MGSAGRLPLVLVVASLAACGLLPTSYRGLSLRCQQFCASAGGFSANYAFSAKDFGRTYSWQLLTEPQKLSTLRQSSRSSVHGAGSKPRLPFTRTPPFHWGRSQRTVTGRSRQCAAARPICSSRSPASETAVAIDAKHWPRHTAPAVRCRNFVSRPGVFDGNTEFGAAKTTKNVQPQVTVRHHRTVEQSPRPLVKLALLLNLLWTGHREF